MRTSVIPLVILSCVLLGCGDGSGSAERPDSSASAPASEDDSSSESVNEPEGTTIALLDLEAGEVSEPFRVESAEPIVIGYHVLLGLAGPNSAAEVTALVEIDRQGDVEPGNVRGIASDSPKAATKFIPQDNHVTVKAHNLSGRRIIVRLFSNP